ncbi:MAG TPA: tripartite tricarboxylate transporter substrate-binding protein [Rubrivivax sp.]|nr:tripartite tricarboxylate transporter substrate-binding protein [Rubrivivax sp.]
MIRRLLCTSLAALLCAAVPWGAAQGFPDRPVQLVVPQAPGGASDVLARALSRKLGEKWKQPVVVENKAGVGGNIGMEQVLAQLADGCTPLMTYAGTHAVNGTLYRNLRFNIERDLVPVTPVTTLLFGIVARTGTPAAIVQKIDAGVREVVAGKDMIDTLGPLGADVMTVSLADFAALVRLD